jgi:predicted nucleic acid-binding Zn ribbon protein
MVKYDLMSEERGGYPERVGSLVEGVLKARGIAEAVERAAVVPEWEQLVGPQIARVAAPVGFDRGTLFVAVRSSAWLMELELQERRILARINAGRKRGKFQRIVFRLAAER